MTTFMLFNVELSSLPYFTFFVNPLIFGNTKCGGPDSNRRIPTKTDLESVAFNLARQPPLLSRII